jgi:hypothetical protein
MADCGLRLFKEWDGHTPFPHRLTTKEAIESRRLAWNAAIELAAKCLGDCNCDTCRGHKRTVENLKAEPTIPGGPYDE